MANMPVSSLRDESLINLMNPTLSRAFSALNNTIVNPFSALPPQNTDLFSLLSMGTAAPPVQALPEGTPEYLTSLVSMVNDMLASSQADTLDPTLATNTAETEKPANTAQITGGGETPTFENNTLSISNKGLNRIWKSPGEIRDVIQSEMAEAFGTNDPAKMVEKLTGVKIKTGFSQERKTLFAWQLLQKITDDMAHKIEQAWQLPKTDLKAPDTNQIQKGGVALGKAEVAQIKANKNDPAKIEAIIAKAMEDATGTTDKSDMMAKIAGVKNLDSKHDGKFSQELYDYTMKDLVKRYTEYV